MSVLVDSSALLAYLDRADPRHDRAVETFKTLVSGEGLLTHNYVVVETVSVAHRRYEPGAARDLIESVFPVIELVWVDAAIHSAAVSAFLAGVRRRVSFVDWVSFEVMRRRGIERAFAFDQDFERQGFKAIP